MAIVLAIGKKGSGKSAWFRKLVALALLDRCLIFFHDPQHQIADHMGRVYRSAREWREDPRPPFLSIFRDCDVEEIADLALSVRDVTLVADELDQAFANKAYLGSLQTSALRRIIHEGRHYRVNLWGGFRRTQNVSEDLISQCDIVALFRVTQTTPQDLETVRLRFGEAYAERVRTLKPLEFVVWSDE